MLSFSPVTELAHSLIGEFEALLDRHKIVLANPERPTKVEAGEIEPANIYGCEYYQLEDRLQEAIIEFMRTRDARQIMEELNTEPEVE